MTMEELQLLQMPGVISVALTLMEIFGKALLCYTSLENSELFQDPNKKPEISLLGINVSTVSMTNIILTGNK